MSVLAKAANQKLSPSHTRLLAYLNENYCTKDSLAFADRFYGFYDCGGDTSSYPHQAPYDIALPISEMREFGEALAPFAKEMQQKYHKEVVKENNRIKRHNRSHPDSPLYTEREIQLTSFGWQCPQIMRYGISFLKPTSAAELLTVIENFDARRSEIGQLNAALNKGLGDEKDGMQAHFVTGEYNDFYINKYRFTCYPRTASNDPTYLDLRKEEWDEVTKNEKLRFHIEFPFTDKMANDLPTVTRLGLLKTPSLQQCAEAMPQALEKVFGQGIFRFEAIGGGYKDQYRLIIDEPHAKEFIRQPEQFGQLKKLIADPQQFVLDNANFKQAASVGRVR